MAKRLIYIAVLCLLPTSLLAVTLTAPTFSYSTGVFLNTDGVSNNFQSIGATPSLQAIEAIQLVPGNISAVYSSGATANVVCTTTDGTTPTATTPGTCSNGTATSCVSPASGCPTVTPTGNCTLEAISTAAGNTNSSVTTATLTISNFYPAAATYGYPVIVTLAGVCGGNVIYTTDGTTPTANASCVATHGTAVANGSTVTMPTTGTTVVTAISCLNGTTAALTGSPATYVTRAPITWYVDTIGGTRYSSNVTAGQCNGQADTAYPGSGVNQACAFSDFRYLWDDDSGNVGQGAWVIAGGDTVIIKGCTASANQINPANPDCRVGWDIGTGGGPTNQWCNAIGNNGCYPPPIPPGQSGHPTLFEGANAASLPPSGKTNPRDYDSQLTQIFGGFGVSYVMDLSNTQYVTFEGLAFTSHNGTCTRFGAPAWPSYCAATPPASDFAQTGFRLNRNTAHITFQDVSIHGFTSQGMFGPFGAGIVFTRVFVGFNTFAGWNMDDGSATPDGPGATVSATYHTMEGNGCLEEYPVTHAFSAKSCWDDTTGGFGDGWSGQDTQLTSFTCLHCNVLYNTKDGTWGPHVLAQSVDIEEMYAAGNMGAQLKWISAVNGTLKLQNSLILGNCERFSDPSTPIPGASQVFVKTSGINGAYLADFCRAGGNAMATNVQTGSTWNINGNTFVNNASIDMFVNCGSAYFDPNNCGTATINSTDNNFLGYTNSPNATGPAVYYTSDSSVVFTSSHVNDYGNKASTGPTCGSNGNICVSPLLVNQPVQQTWTNESYLDVFGSGPTGSWLPTSGSPLIGAGVAVSGMTTDYAGKNQTSPPTIGAFVYTAPPPGLGGGMMSGRIASLVITCPSTAEDCSNCFVFNPSTCQIKVVYK